MSRRMLQVLEFAGRAAPTVTVTGTIWVLVSLLLGMASRGNVLITSAGTLAGIRAVLPWTCTGLVLAWALIGCSRLPALLEPTLARARAQLNREDEVRRVEAVKQARAIATLVAEMQLEATP